MGVSMPLLSSTTTVGREAEQALLRESLARQRYIAAGYSVVVDRSFEPELIAAVATIPVDAVEADLATACRSGLVRVDGEGRFAFAHDKIRGCLLAEIPASRRRLSWREVVTAAPTASPCSPSISPAARIVAEPSPMRWRQPMMRYAVMLRRRRSSIIGPRYG